MPAPLRQRAVCIDNAGLQRACAAGFASPRARLDTDNLAPQTVVLSDPAS